MTFEYPGLRIVISDLEGEVKFPHHLLKGHIQFCQTKLTLSLMDSKIERS